MTERLKLAALMVALLFGSLFVVTALAQSTTAASAGPSNQGRGMMGGTTSQSDNGRLGGGMMGGMMGGGNGQSPDFNDMGGMMNSTVGGAWQGMVSYCSNLMSQFGDWFGNATSP
jgi:hypothetical protein